MPVIPELERLRQEESREFQASPDYPGRLCLQKANKRRYHRKFEKRRVSREPKESQLDDKGAVEAGRSHLTETLGLGWSSSSPLSQYGITCGSEKEGFTVH